MLDDIAPTLADISRWLGIVTSPPVQVLPHHHISWSPPQVDTIKVNTNESFTNGLTQGGIGGIFRNNQGNPFLHFGK